MSASDASSLQQPPFKVNSGPPSEPKSDSGRGDYWESPSQVGTPLNRRVRKSSINSDSSSSVASDAEEKRVAEEKAARQKAAEKKRIAEKMRIAEKKAVQQRAAEDKRVAEDKTLKKGGQHEQRWKEYVEHWRKVGE